MTVAEKLGSMYYLRQFKTAWYLDGKILRSIDTEILKSEDVYDFGNYPYRVGSFTVTCDEKYFVFGVNMKIRQKKISARVPLQCTE